MRCLLAGMAVVAPVVAMISAANATPDVELRLVAERQVQLEGEQSTLQLVVVNSGADPVYVDRGFMQTEISIGFDGEWVKCGQMHRGTPGVRVSAKWDRIEPGSEIPISLGGYWCPEDAGPVSRGTNWTDTPGTYRFQVKIAHRMPAHELERIGPAPAGAREWVTKSNIAEVTVAEAVGIDATAIKWAREHAYHPVSIEVESKFPESFYGALMTWQRLTLHDGDPEQITEYMKKGFYPGRYSVPDASSPDGQRRVNAGEDMARWRIEHGKRLLREHPDFPYERGVRLSMAVSYTALGYKDQAMRLLKALQDETGTPESQWASRFATLQGWQ